MSKVFISSLLLCIIVTNNSFSSTFHHPAIVPGTDSIPLSLSMSQNAVICEGDTVQIWGEATGGSGIYNYSWTPINNLSNPNVSNPYAYPDSSITYTLTVNDGVDSISDSVSITVFHCPKPEIIAYPNDTVDLNETIVLNLGGGYLAYFWQDSSTDSIYLATNTSGPNGGEQQYWGTVFGASGCSGSDTISVWFLPLLDIEDRKVKTTFDVYFKPIEQKIYCSSEDFQGEIKVDILTANGVIAYEETRNYNHLEKYLEIDISCLRTGFYLVSIHSSEGELLAVKKILK